MQGKRDPYITRKLFGLIGIGDKSKELLKLGHYDQTSMWGDDSNAFVVAIDFDGTITSRPDSIMGYRYGERASHDLNTEFTVRPEMVRFIRFLNMIGAVAFIYSCRCSNKSLADEIVMRLALEGVDAGMYTFNVDKYWDLSLETDMGASYKPVFHICFDDANAGVPVIKEGQHPAAIFRTWFSAGLNDMFFNRMCLKDDIFVRSAMRWIMDGMYLTSEDNFKFACNKIAGYLKAIYNNKPKHKKAKK